MTTLRLEIPDGMFCKGCSYLLEEDQRDGSTKRCKIFDCMLGNKMTDIFKCPFCIEQSRGHAVTRGE